MSKQPRSRFLPYLFEFVVVVLGVTVSFGLDSWRHDRQQAALHTQDIRSLLEDLSGDRARITDVKSFIAEGKVAFLQILKMTNAQRRGDIEFGEFASQLMKLGTPYRFATFYMNNSTYKSLLANGRLQLFPEAINKKLRHYYEYVSKRVEDNNDIVDQITLRYYNEDHPWVNYKHGAEALKDIGLIEEFDERTREDAGNYFTGPGVREHYTQLSFLHGTLSVYDRIVTHGMQVELYSRLRDELAGVVEGYAK
jgi:hypothetical protein